MFKTPRRQYGENIHNIYLNEMKIRYAVLKWSEYNEKKHIKIGQKIKNLHLKTEKSTFGPSLKKRARLDHPKPITTCTIYWVSFC